MGSLPTELSLDLRPTSDPKRIIESLREASSMSNVEDKVLKLQEVVKMLEDERGKIDAFKRELPLCILIMNDAISNLKEELVQCRVTSAKPVLEQYMPLKKEHVKDEENTNENDHRDKKNWMSSFQLWNIDANPSATYTLEPKRTSLLDDKKQENQSLPRADEIFQTSTDRNGGSGFMPVKTYPGVPFVMMRKKEGNEESPVPGLSFLTPAIKNSSVQLGSYVSRTSRAVANGQSKLRSSQLQSSRKQRRCWSPELHRRFVSALQQLGGAQAATPKQIRDLMQVEGLTNDEVKSHLQKYRLHTRRLPAATAASANQSVMVLGGLWMSQDQYGDFSKGSSSQSDSPQGPFQLAESGGGSSPVGEDSMDDDEDDVKSES